MTASSRSSSDHKTFQDNSGKNTDNKVAKKKKRNGTSNRNRHPSNRMTKATVVINTRGQNVHGESLYKNNNFDDVAVAHALRPVSCTRGCPHSNPVKKKGSAAKTIKNNSNNSNTSNNSNSNNSSNGSNGSNNNTATTTTTMMTTTTSTSTSTFTVYYHCYSCCYCCYYYHCCYHHHHHCYS